MLTPVNSNTDIVFNDKTYPINTIRIQEMGWYYVSDFPERFVAPQTTIQPNCWCCDTEEPMFWTTIKNWAKLPTEYLDMVLCLRCYKVITNGHQLTILPSRVARDYEMTLQSLSSLSIYNFPICVTQEELCFK